MKTIELAKGISIENYEEFKKTENKEKISELIYQRFYERYIEPFLGNDKRHGFSMMAVSCLMIEALQSFKNGKENTRGRGVSEKTFKEFFCSTTHLSEFKEIDFYTNIRCGILHQAETYAGWRIRRDGKKLLDAKNKTIDADLFLDKLKHELKDYKDKLNLESFKSDAWKKALDKLDYICKNSCYE
jgi:hypothetical protein